jgi:hypothetical protein
MEGIVLSGGFDFEVLELKIIKEEKQQLYKV